MSIYQGYDGSFKIGSDATAETSNWSLTINNETFDRKVFGASGWTETSVVGKSWSGSCSGYLDLTDTAQLAQYTAVISGTTVAPKFYVDGTHYFEPDTVSDADACAVIESFVPEADASGQITFSCSFKGNGPLRYV